MTGERFTKFVKNGEKAEPLGDGYYIIQSESWYRFGSDAVALAHYASRFISKNSRVFDLCSGCGIIGIMLAISSGCTVNGAEIYAMLCDMSNRSCALNGLDSVHFNHADVRNTDKLPAAEYDMVVCNPPYYKADSKPSSVAPQASSELTVKLSQVVAAAKRLLKVGGSLCMVHISSRLDEVLIECNRNGLAPKELIVNPNGKTFMLRAVRGGKQGMTVTVKEFD
ncbi:MAG: methyltransferase [Clostridiales bacterium]|nr:methyltransferase [Clostridiales bacterium]